MSEKTNLICYILFGRLPENSHVLGIAKMTVRAVYHKIGLNLFSS
jgi:hypothetical protein